MMKLIYSCRVMVPEQDDPRSGMRCLRSAAVFTAIITAIVLILIYELVR